MRNPFSLEGKTVLVSGASSGIGRATAVQCSELGAQLILLGRNEEELQRTQRQLEEPARHRYYTLDLLHLGEQAEALAADLAPLGGIHGMVHAAGISPTLPFRSGNAPKLREVFEVNVLAALELSRLLSRKAFIPASGQSIVFISSVMSVVGEPGKALYGMSKGALVAAAKSMAVELARYQVRVNCISPAVVQSPMSSRAEYSKDPAALAAVTARHPLGLGEPEDVANACVYLLSDAARWVTGTNLLVDGGYSAR